MKTALLIYRAPQFSPGSTDADRLVLNEVGQQMPQGSSGDIYNIIYVREENLLTFAENNPQHFDVIIHLCRSKAALQWLSDYGNNHRCLILNSPDAVLANTRSRMEASLHSLGFPTAGDIARLHPTLPVKGYWIKADDTSDSSPLHVRYRSASSPLPTASPESIIQPHIEGECVKFYGVSGTGFHFSPNTLPPHTAQRLFSMADALADEMHLDIYGGDAILTPHEEICIIDLNDFPSFSSCRREAAAAIASKLTPPN
ncbi:MAG: hypothetical protein HUK08_03110 [Bacteroidaceae bacterium]|nr:hypothetical protein [Bacteroidaceae bacterium]